MDIGPGTLLATYHTIGQCEIMLNGTWVGGGYAARLAVPTWWSLYGDNYTSLNFPVCTGIAFGAAAPG